MINSVKGNINDRLIRKIEQIYSGRPWYGKSIKDILDMPGKSIPIESLGIINHMIAWRDFISSSLKGREYTIEINSEKDWPQVVGTAQEIISNLDRSQVELIEAIRSFDDQYWNSKPNGARYTYLELTEAIMDHDIYHLGQIALRNKEANSKTAS